MPMGSHHAVLGIAGYSLAAHVISKRYQKTPLRSLEIGLARTGIGVVFGCAYVAAWAALARGGEGSPKDALFLAGFIPLRLVEWSLLLILFYDRRLVHRKRAMGVVAAGTAWSFLLDIPAIFGLIKVGGFWIC